MTDDIDEKCLELARHFLADRPDLAGQERDLAWYIQVAVEQWFSE